MHDQNTDILIAGAGLAGLIAASAFAHAGYRILLVDPAPRPTDPTSSGSDLRSTAFLQPARNLLAEIGLWDALAPHAVALNTLRIANSTGTPPSITETRSFQSDELGAAPFGWNLPNWHSHKILLSHLEKQPLVTLQFGTGVKALLTRDREAIVTLSDQSRIRARLVIGADGRNSVVRDALDISVQTTRYGQKALAFSATHSLPHDNISTEIYRSGGAFTTVPLPDHQRQPCSAIVWMNDGPTAQSLAAMPLADFNAAMTDRACAILGPMTRVGDLRLWPVVTQTAQALTAQRCALIAEAAHVLPPIGAQGLNTSLHDIATLYDLMRQDAGALGTSRQLDQYEKARHADIERRTRAIDLFNRICKSGGSPIQALRSAGLRAVHDIAPLRRKLMQAGLGPQQ